MTTSLTAVTLRDTAPLVSAFDLRRIELAPLVERIAERNIYDLVKSAAKKWPNKIAISFLPLGLATDTPINISFEDMAFRVTQIANALQKRGVKRETGIGFLTPNLPDAYSALLAAQTAGRASPVNPLLSTDHIVNIMTDTDVAILFTVSERANKDLYEKTQLIAKKLPNLPIVITLDERQDGALFLHDLIDGEPGDKLAGIEPASPNDIACAFHTGGTTSAPKIVGITHYNQLATTCMGLLGSGYCEDDVSLAALPMYHAIAGIATPLVAMAAGMTTLLCGPLGYRNPHFIMDFWKIISKHKVCTAAVVPTVLSALVNIQVDEDISSLRTLMCGAAPLPVALINELQMKTSAEIVEIYGMTEASTFCARNPVGGEKKAGSVGPAVAYQELRVVTKSEKGGYADVELGQNGTVVIRGPNVVSTTLFKNADGAMVGDERVDVDGWLDTGDLGHLDNDGYLWLQGRAKDLIIRGGHNIDPRMIEEALSAHPAVVLVGAVGQPDGYAGEVPIAYVTLSKKDSISQDELESFAREAVSERPAAPRRIEIIEEMPLTTVGKIYKPTLRIMAAEHAVRSILNEFIPSGCQLEIHADEAAAGAVRFVKIITLNFTKMKHAEFVSLVQKKLEALNIQPTIIRKSIQ